MFIVIVTIGLLGWVILFIGGFLWMVNKEVQDVSSEEQDTGDCESK